MSEQTQSENADRLIGRIEAEAEAECRKILEAAGTEAEAIVAAARAQARERLRGEVANLRRDGAQAVSRIASRIDTERRQLRQRRGVDAQARGLGRLCKGLDALWHDEAARALWCARVLDEAKAHLLPGPWRVRHPAGWPEAERAAFAQAVEAHTGQAPEFALTERAQSGLAVQAGGACLDATGPALCRETPRLRALFQSEFEAMGEEGAA